MLLSGKPIKVTDCFSFMPSFQSYFSRWHPPSVGGGGGVRDSLGLGGWVTLFPGEPVMHSAAEWCRAWLGGAGRESRAELDSGYGRRGCFMAVSARLAGGCLWENIIASLFITCILAFSLQSVPLPSWSIRNTQRSCRSTRGPKSTHTHHTPAHV